MENQVIKKSNTVKLNEVLGIQSIEDVLNNLSVEKNDESFNQTLIEIDEHVKSQMEIVEQQNHLAANNSGEFNVHTMESALSEVSSLIDVSKGIIQKVYEYVVTSDLLDPEVISAGAKMIEAARIAVSDYVDMYKSQIQFFNQIQMEMIKHKNRLEILDHKLKCDVDKVRQLEDKVADDVDLIEYTQERVISAMRDAGRNNKIIDVD